MRKNRLALFVIIALCCLGTAEWLLWAEDPSRQQTAWKDSRVEQRAARAEIHQLAQESTEELEKGVQMAAAAETRPHNPLDDFPLPNSTTDGPRVIHMDYFTINIHYPTYLLCTYDVNENHYDPTDEPGWFSESLLQIRNFGPKRFPPIQYVAVAIINRVGWVDVHSYAQAYKVAALFDAKAVFNDSVDLGPLIRQAKMDRHPFMYDPQQPTPGEMDRWLIIERHATATRAASPPTN